MNNAELNKCENISDLILNILRFSSEVKEIATFFDKVFNYIESYCGVIGAGVYIVEYPGKNISLCNSLKLPDEYLKKYKEIPAFKSLYHKIFEQGILHTVSDFKIKKEKCDILFIPIFSKGDIIGSFSFIFSENFDFDDNFNKFFVMLGYLTGNFIEKIKIESKYNKVVNDIIFFESTLSENSKYDFLTKLRNKYAFHEIIDLEIERECRYKNPLSIIIFDIDRLSNINQLYSMEIGDFVLIEVVKNVSKLIRKNDYFFRWHGGTFILLLPGTPSEKAIKLAERIRKKVNTQKFDKLKKVSCSAGVTQLLPDDNYNTIVKRASKILYTAKVSGKNNVVFAT